MFGALLDPERGGHWRIAPEDEDSRTAQFYIPDTNVLITRFMNPGGVVELQDFMPVGEHQRLVRRLVCVRGKMKLRSELPHASTTDAANTTPAATSSESCWPTESSS